MPALIVLGGFILFVVVMAISAVWSGYALSVLWAWFIVPTFKLPPLTINSAIGIALVVSYLTHQLDDNYDKTETWSERFGKAMFYAAAKPAFALVVGWVVLQFA